MDETPSDEREQEVCYVCQGLIGEDCEVCGGEGFLGGEGDDEEE